LEKVVGGGPLLVNIPTFGQLFYTINMQS